MAGFDIDGARKAGYSDAEIVDHLAQQSKFNAAQARASGYSDAELLQHLAGATPGVQPAPKLKPEDTPGVIQTLGIGAGRTFDKVLDGLTQAWLAVAPGDNESTKRGLKMNVEEKDRLYKPLQEARPIATAVGESLPSLVATGGMGSGATALGTAGKLFASGAIPSALEYGTPEERAKRAAISGVASVVGGQVVPKALQVTGAAVKNGVSALAGKVSPEVAALYQKAVSLGIPVNMAQLSDSKFVKTLASAVESMPFTGASATRQAQQDAFNRAVSRTFGEDAPKVTRDLYDAARTRLGKQFEDLSARNNLNVTPALLSDVGNVSNSATKFATQDTNRAVTNAIDELMSKMDPTTGTIPGAAYQSLDSQLSKLLKGGDEKSVYLGQLRDAIRSAMDHSIAPADQAAWSTARSQYKNLKAVRDLVAKDGADGNISPALLMGRLNATQAGKETMARGGRGELGDIAQVGKQFLLDKIPNSGTAQRALALSVLGGGGLAAGADPQTVAGLMLAGATSGRLANKVLNSPASGARIMQATAPQTLSDLLKIAPSRAAQVAGSGTGLTIADLYDR